MHDLLGRREEFDERSRGFPIVGLLTAEQAQRPRSYTWRCDMRLSQVGPRCVGAAWTHEAAARPKPVRGLAWPDAARIYFRAQQLDQWPGEGYAGTSVLAGAKAAAEHGWYVEYRWAFGLADLVLALGYKGPAVLGLNWYSGMFEPDAAGRIQPSGRVEGGHAIVAVAADVRRERVWLVNSWGEGWGVRDRYGHGGACWLSFGDLDRLLREDGEACVPVLRRLP